MTSGELGPDTRRILVYGVTGSGKTTLACRLATLTSLPWHAVDDLTWEPGWVPVPVEEQRRRIAQICAAPAWILDSAYGDWLDVTLDSVDLVVALDYQRWFSLQRLLRRCAVRLVDRRPICNGNRETLRVLLARDSIVAWHFRSFQRKRERMRRWEAASDGPPVRRLTSPAETAAWLRTVRARVGSQVPARRRESQPAASAKSSDVVPGRSAPRRPSARG